MARHNITDRPGLVFNEFYAAINYDSLKIIILYYLHRVTSGLNIRRPAPIAN